MLFENIGKSRRIAIEDAVPDYLASFDAVYDVADYIAINVSSPNTPSLREMQRPETLSRLLAGPVHEQTVLAVHQNHSHDHIDGYSTRGDPG